METLDRERLRTPRTGRAVPFRSPEKLREMGDTAREAADMVEREVRRIRERWWCRL